LLPALQLLPCCFAWPLLSTTAVAPAFGTRTVVCIMKHYFSGDAQAVEQVHPVYDK
jgi:hypothetical protein